MAASSTEQLFQRLIDDYAAGDFEACLRHVQGVLSHKADDADALQAKAVVLIQQGKIDSALEALLPSQKLERAYCFYRLQRLDEALSALGPVDPNNPAMTHLRAQILYRQGRFQDAFEEYRQMKTRGHDSREVLTNLLAAAASASLWNPELAALASQQLADTTAADVYELAYNTSCLYLVAGDFEAALNAVARSLAICQQQFSGADLVNESALAQAHRAFLLHSGRGRTEEAIAIYEDLLRNQPQDRVVLAVAANNLAAIDPHHKHLSSLNKLERNATSPELQAKLSHAQRRVANLNYALVLLKAGKLDKCQQFCDALPADAKLSVIVQAAILAAQQQMDAATSLLQGAAAAGDIKAQLALAQLAYQPNPAGYEHVVRVLQGIAALQHTPGWVASLVWLFQRLERPQQSLEVTEQAADFWLAQPASVPKAAQHARCLLKVTGQLAMKTQQFPRAAAAYRKLLNLLQNKPDEHRFFLAHLVRALSYFDLDAAAQLSQQLPEVPADHTACDPVQLENLPLPRFKPTATTAPAPAASSAPLPASSSSSSTSTATAPAEAILATPAPANKTKPGAKKKKRRPNKKRLPANYDPKFVHPDKQRWLPLEDRTYYKRQLRAKKMTIIDRSAQGVRSTAAPASSVQVTAVTRGVSTTPAPTPASSTSTPAPAPAPAAPRGKPGRRGRGGRR